MSIPTPLQAVYRFAIAIVLIAMAVAFRSYIVASIVPFFIAFILADLMAPGIHLLHARLRLPRPAAVIAVFLILLVAGGYGVTLVTAKLLAELVDMSSQAGVYQSTIVQIGTDLLERLTQVADQDLFPPQIQRAITNTIETVSRQGEQLVRSSIQSLLDAFVSLPELLVIVIITLMAAFFIAKDRELISKSLFRIAPARWRARLRTAQDRILVDMVGFLKAHFLLFVITTAAIAVSLNLIGSRYWLTLAFIISVLNLIPIIGPGIVLIPWAGVSLLLGDVSFSIALIMIYLVIVVIQQTLQPKLLGDSIGVHPLLMLAALYAGIVFFGLRGFVAGPVLVIVIRALFVADLIRISGDGTPTSEATQSNGRDSLPPR